uniref:Uncharacterized protein n=1 Tax=Caenorhabditis japonica TaxID=281687 RepID=A0A8R1INH4_CAEJA
MTSPVCKVFDKPIDSNQKIVACSNKLSHLKKLTQMNTQEKQKVHQQQRVPHHPVGSKDVAITRAVEVPKKDKPFVSCAPAPPDALAVFAFVTPAGTLTITRSVFFGTPLKK